MSAAVAAPLRLRLPATSANLGPGFDSLALALDLHLAIDARVAESGDFSIEASGRSVAVCSALKGNLLLDTYTSQWARHATGAALPLALKIDNGIPLGMGCGSSAASRLAGIALASHFAGLDLSPARMLEEATALEHHPDNAAACCLGGFVASGYGAVDPSSGLRGVQALSIAPPSHWHALLVLPEVPLATTASRAVLPDQYRRDEVVTNLQNVAVLVAAFAQGNSALLRAATADCMHQPYRGAVCPLLPRLLPLAGTGGILSVTLSGAGSGVLCLLESEAAVPQAAAAIRHAAEHVGGDDALGLLPIAELLSCGIGRAPAVLGAQDEA